VKTPCILSWSLVGASHPHGGINNSSLMLSLEGMQRGESIQENFSRILEFKEQLEAIGDTIDEDELIMTTLNDLTRPWDAFIQTICARTKKLKFDGRWAECIQEETRVAGREALLARDEDQALATHTKGGRKKSHFQKETHKESHPQNKSQPKRFQKKG
jgi:hypothetical protein